MNNIYTLIDFATKTINEIDESLRKFAEEI